MRGRLPGRDILPRRGTSPGANRFAGRPTGRPPVGRLLRTEVFRARHGRPERLWCTGDREPFSYGRLRLESTGLGPPATLLQLGVRQRSTGSVVQSPQPWPEFVYLYFRRFPPRPGAYAPDPDPWPFRSHSVGPRSMPSSKLAAGSAGYSRGRGGEPPRTGLSDFGGKMGGPAWLARPAPRPGLVAVRLGGSFPGATAVSDLFDRVAPRGPRRRRWARSSSIRGTRAVCVLRSRAGPPPGSQLIPRERTTTTLQNEGPAVEVQRRSRPSECLDAVTLAGRAQTSRSALHGISGFFIGGSARIVLVDVEPGPDGHSRPWSRGRRGGGASTHLELPFPERPHPLQRPRVDLHRPRPVVPPGS